MKKKNKSHLVASIVERASTRSLFDSRCEKMRSISSPSMAARCTSRPAMPLHSVSIAAPVFRSRTRRNPTLLSSESTSSTTHFRRRHHLLVTSASSPSSSSRSNDDVVDANSVEVALESAALRALLLCWFAMQVTFV